MAMREGRPGKKGADGQERGQLKVRQVEEKSMPDLTTFTCQNRQKSTEGPDKKGAVGKRAAGYQIREQLMVKQIGGKQTA
jgi:hypothetical protein